MWCIFPDCRGKYNNNFTKSNTFVKKNNMKLKILAASFIIGLSVVTYKALTYDPVPSIIESLRDGNPVTLDSGVVYNFTGYKNLPVTSEFNLNGATIKADSMLQAEFNDNQYLFLLDGGYIHSGAIIGASGKVYNAKAGYFGAIQVMTGGKIRAVNFKNCDKWAIRVFGDRWSHNDTTFITSCVFDSIPRDGSGYGTWNQHGVVIVDSCKFNFLRHAFDCGSEGNLTVIQNCEFRNCFYIPIHQHRYVGDSVGVGLTVRNCKFYDTYMPLDIGLPFKGMNRIDSNYFAGNYIGRMGRDTIPIGTNYMNGKGMAPAPEIIGRNSYRVGEKMSLKIDKTGFWNNGVTNRQTTTTFNYPMVKVYSVHTGGIADTMTVICSDTGSYTSMRVLATCDIEFWSGDKVIGVVKKGKAYDYKFYYFKADVKIKIKGNLIGVDRATFNVADGYRALRVRTNVGVLHLDNLCYNGWYDTYEFGLKTKVKQVGEWVEVGK